MPPSGSARAKTASRVPINPEQVSRSPVAALHRLTQEGRKILMTALTLYDKVWNAARRQGRMTTVHRCSTSIGIWFRKSPVRKLSRAWRREHRQRAGGPTRTCAVADHAVPTRFRDRPASGRPGLAPGRAASRQQRALRHHLYSAPRPAPRHRPRHRPRARLHPARRDPGVRRQSYLHPRRIRRDRVRHRVERMRMRAGDAGAPPAEAEAHARDA